MSVIVQKSYISDIEKKEASILRPSTMELDKRDSCLFKDPKSKKYDNYDRRPPGCVTECKVPNYYLDPSLPPKDYVLHTNYLNKKQLTPECRQKLILQQALHKAETTEEKAKILDKASTDLETKHSKFNTKVNERAKARSSADEAISQARQAAEEYRTLVNSNPDIFAVKQKYLKYKKKYLDLQSQIANYIVS